MKYGPHELMKLIKDLQDDLEEAKKKVADDRVLLGRIEDSYQTLIDNIEDVSDDLKEAGYGK